MAFTREVLSDDVVRVVHEPGNMTRYELIATRVKHPGGDSWVFSFPSNRVCVAFPDGFSLDMHYVGAKLPDVGLSTADLREMLRAISIAVPGTLVWLDRP